MNDNRSDRMFRPQSHLSPNVETRKLSNVVIFVPVICPQCGQKRAKVTSTVVPVRYHRCQQCGHTFKSLEKTAIK